MPYKEIYLSASVMCMNWMHIKKDIDLLEKLNIDYLHYDIMDGFFVPEFNFGPHIINSIQKNTSIPSDYHFMVEEPKKMFDHFSVKTDDYFCIHYEACRNLHRDLVTIRKMNVRSGLVLNPATTLENIEYVIEEVDCITIMTVNPGYAGQKIVSQTIQKVKKLNDWRKSVGYDIRIAVDGNVSIENIPNMIANGADMLVLGSSGLFLKNLTLEESYNKLTDAIDSGLNRKN